MAKNITTKFSVDLSGSVSSSIDAVKAIRKREQARREAEFQRAIASGLSYEEQLVLRKKQLEEENKSSFSDADYIASLEKSIADTQKLSRFNKYRNRYATSLGELSAGKINEEQYLSILKSQLNNIDDPDLRLEIQTDITAAEAKLKTYKDTILSNQVKKAKYDGTRSALDEAVARVNAAKTEALINENEDEVTAHDETLSALRSQISSVSIQDSITDFQVKSSTRGTNPIEKLNYINSEIQKADSNTSIKIGDRTYASAQQFWSLERDGFLAGSSQIFGNFFDELGSHVKNTVDVAAARFGYPTQSTLDEALQIFNDLRAKPELAPFVNRLDITQASTMNDGVDKYAKHLLVVVQGTKDFSFKQADAELQRISTKYGVDVTADRVQLQNLSLSDANIPEEAVPELDLKVPGEEKKPMAPSGVVVAPIVPTVSGVREVREGDNLTDIAKEASISVDQILELNPELRVNPNFIKPGQQIKLPGATQPVSAQTTGTLPAGTQPVSPSTTPTPTPTPTPVPEAPKTAPVVPASSYTGSSVVDYLKSINQDSSVVARAKLAFEKGIVKTEDEYLKAAQVGANAQFNERLLKALRG